MLERLSPARRNFALLVLAAAVLWFCWTVRSVLNPLILAYLLAYVLHPLVERLEARGWSRKTAVNVIFISAAACSWSLGVSLTLQAKSWRPSSAATRRSSTTCRSGSIRGSPTCSTSWRTGT
jgi:predicted PurR-regulated permease PerM